MPGLTIPAFDWGFVKLAAADAGRRRPADGDRLREPSGGMGTAAFLAFLMSLCNQRFTATQFALLSALCLGRPGLGRAAGRRAGAVDRLAGVLHRCRPWWPCRRLAMLWWLRASVRALEADPARRARRWTETDFRHRCRPRLPHGAGCACALHARPALVRRLLLGRRRAAPPPALARSRRARRACAAAPAVAALHQAGPGRAGGAGRGAAVRAAAAQAPQKHALAPRQPSAGAAPARHRPAPDPHTSSGIRAPGNGAGRST